MTASGNALPDSRYRDELSLLILEEALLLSAEGQPGRGLSLIEEAKGLFGLAPAVLRRLRVALEQEMELQLAAQVLGARSGGAAPLRSWQANLSLARLAFRRGRLKESAEFFKQTVETFRSEASSLGRAADSLAAMIEREVGEFSLAAARRERVDQGPEPDPSERTRSELVDLIRFGERVALETEPEEVLRLVLDKAVKLAGAERGFVVIDRDGEFEVELVANRTSLPLRDTVFELSRTLLREVVRTGEAAYLSVSEEQGAHPAGPSLHDLGVRCVACVPITGDGSMKGALYLDHRGREQFVSESIREVLELLAGQAGAALINARRHHSRNRELETARETIRRHRSDSQRRARFGKIVGSSGVMQSVYRRLERFTATELPVLIHGETGTGKELAAQAICRKGDRSAGEFVALNCAGVSDSLLESELFGWERGAFTGAERSRPGLFELADSGTLFLDEVGDMSPRMQAALLRVLESGEVRRLGGSETSVVDVRLIAATHRDLEQAVREGRFRQDLFFRINVLQLTMPALREHAEDIPALSRHFFERTGKGSTPPRFSREAMAILLRYDWPGNVRELENLVQRLALLGEPEIEASHLPQRLLRPERRRPLSGTLEEIEREAIEQALELAEGNKSAAARALGIDRKTLRLKLRRYRR